MGYHLAQVNIGRFIRPVEDPANADFVNALDHVNALAEASPGFVWRLTGEGNNATDIKPFPTIRSMAINMSVWESVDALAAFVYRNMDHRGVMRRRREWFEEMTGLHGPVVDSGGHSCRPSRTPRRSSASSSASGRRRRPSRSGSLLRRRAGRR